MAQVQNDVLQLPNEVKFLNAARLPSKLYVRKAYEDLHSLIHDTYRHRSILVVGNPGTGKSFFALYEMYRLLKDGATIVYECLPFSVFMVLTAEQLLYAGPRLEMRHPLVRELFRNHQTYYLFDAGTQRDIYPYCGVAAKTIVFSSPAKKNYHDYVKHSDPKMLYMPVWTLDELERVVGSVQAQTRYKIWGGIPRYVLKLDQDTTPIDDAVATLTPESLHNLAYKLEELGTPTVSHIILHIHVARDEEGKPIYDRRGVFFASDYVKEKVFDRFATSAIHQMCFYVENVGSYTGFEGQLFEMLAHQKLAAGGTFSVRKLQPNCSVSSTWTFNKFDVEYLEKVDDLTNYRSRQNGYLRPRPRNFTSLDSIIIESPHSVIGVQLTVSSSHPVKKIGLTDVMKYLQCRQAQFKLFFVVPKKVFDNYKPQSYTGSRDSVLECHSLHNVEQWVLLLKLCEE